MQSIYSMLIFLINFRLKYQLFEVMLTFKKFCIKPYELMLKTSNNSNSL
jgi:hypothetical protein